MLYTIHKLHTWGNLMLMISHHSKFKAHTGNPHPNISTTFIGRSRPDEDLWRHTPRSAEPASKNEFCFVVNPQFAGRVRVTVVWSLCVYVCYLLNILHEQFSKTKHTYSVAHVLWVSLETKKLLKRKIVGVIIHTIDFPIQFTVQHKRLQRDYQ